MSRNKKITSWFVDDKSAPIDLFSFHQESGQSYRPFRDPKRVETIDFKKRDGINPRIYIKGVPASFLGIMNTPEASGTTDTWGSRKTPKQPSLEFFSSLPELDSGSESLRDEDEEEDDLDSQGATNCLSMAEDHTDERSPIENRVHQWLAAQLGLRIEIPPGGPSLQYVNPTPRAALTSAYARHQTDSDIQSMPRSACLTVISPGLDAFSSGCHLGEELPSQGGDGANSTPLETDVCDQVR